MQIISLAVLSFTSGALQSDCKIDFAKYVNILLCNITVHGFRYSPYWKPRVVMIPTLSLLVALELVIMTAGDRRIYPNKCLIQREVFPCHYVIVQAIKIHVGVFPPCGLMNYGWEQFWNVISVVEPQRQWVHFNIERQQDHVHIFRQILNYTCTEWNVRLNELCIPLWTKIGASELVWPHLKSHWDISVVERNV